MPSASVPRSRHKSVGNLGRLIKTIAMSRKLKTEDVRAVIADLYQYAVGDVDKGYTSEIPPFKLRRPSPPRFERMLNSAENTLPDETPEMLSRADGAGWRE